MKRKGGPAARLLGAALATLLMLLAPATRGQHLVQGAVDGLTDAQVAHAAATLVGQQPGVLMARFDAITLNMMLHVTPDCAIDASLLNAWLAPLEVRVRCYSRRDAREAPFRHVDAQRCGGNPDHAR